MLLDRRELSRHEVQLNGRILSCDMTFSVECAIRDLSETGALVSTTAPERLPAKVFLWHKETGALFECAVRWHKADMLFGLHFLDICGRAQRRALIEHFALSGQQLGLAGHGAYGERLDQIEAHDTQTVFYLPTGGR